MPALPHARPARLPTRQCTDPVGCATRRLLHPPRKPLVERLFNSKSEQPDAIVGPAGPETVRASSPRPRPALQAGSTLPRPPCVLCGAATVHVRCSSASPGSSPAPCPLDQRHRLHIVRRHLVLSTYLIRLGRTSLHRGNSHLRARRALPSRSPSAASPRRPPARRTPPHHPPPRRIFNTAPPRSARSALPPPARCHRAARPHGIVHLKLKVVPLDDMTQLCPVFIGLESPRGLRSFFKIVDALSAALNYCEWIDRLRLPFGDTYLDVLMWRGFFKLLTHSHTHHTRKRANMARHLAHSKGIGVDEFACLLLLCLLTPPLPLRKIDLRTATV
jgi:hypothetical protein